MLRDCRIADAEKLRHLADRAFSIDKLANNQETMAVGKRFQKFARLLRRRVHRKR